MEKLFVFVYITCVMLILGFLLSVSVGIYDYNRFVNLLDKNYNSIYTIFTIVILIIISLILLMSLFKRNKTSYLIKYSPDGEITITFDTIKSIVYKASQQIRGLKDVKVFIKPKGEKVCVLIRGTILPELNVPQTVNELQKLVKEKIETYIEIPVEEVKVVVEDLAAATRLR
ncbi:alkaline shock response membrane anchor protein AmaP [Thermobrachium celere]|uniref:Alkaline shock response membrane anchor protein AmaP n=1 Tax=Thermobrachium celere DSM 8682 TaxID=941824 RepID=R7RQ70_9CLOT|nr:alkaline shock response membrane anchor protein AmaP [Thermobrachium celere]GFR34266.1 hypothetical protein TCEA9_00780 [Thermobrachium celere]CDF58209.1 hypothetical protein TCEL_00255 [Thermobrachium celere DSM 8682]